MKKRLAFAIAIFFTVLAISFAWMMIGGNQSITYIHIAIPTILGTLCVKVYRTYKADSKSTE